MKKKQEKMSRQEKPPKEAVAKTDFLENVGKVFINLGQIIFGTLFLGGVLQGEIPHYLIIILGGIGTLTFLMFGVIISSKERKSKEA